MSAADAGASGRPQGPAGRLWVVATPLGNLGDITARAREAIAECDLVACEDTRVTGGLLRHLAISKPMLAISKQFRFCERVLRVALAILDECIHDPQRHMAAIEIYKLRVNHHTSRLSTNIQLRLPFLFAKP